MTIHYRVQTIRKRSAFDSYCTWEFRVLVSPRRVLFFRIYLCFGRCRVFRSGCWPLTLRLTRRGLWGHGGPVADFCIGFARPPF